MVCSVSFYKIMQKMSPVCAVACGSHYTCHQRLPCRLPFKVDTACAFLVACQVAFPVSAVLAHVACWRINGVIPVKDAVVPAAKADNFGSWSGTFGFELLSFTDRANIDLDILQPFDYKISFLNYHLISPMNSGFDGFLSPERQVS
ncbi:Uncharacterised protein [uncultured archaeon]|nr:Uncharacterised protein [uncultured archaeon]